MLKDNDYEACFGTHATSDDTVESMYTTKTTFLQQGPREREADTSSTMSVPLHGSVASSVAGRTVTSQLIQPKITPYRRPVDMEAPSNNYHMGQDFSIDDLPVYDTDDGAYTEIDLHADSTQVSSKSDPQLILIQSQKSEDEVDEGESNKRTSCLSRLCVRFLA